MLKGYKDDATYCRLKLRFLQRAKLYKTLVA